MLPSASRMEGDVGMAEERFEFRSDAAELLKMMIGSVYSDRDIFLRELISNASDALDKARIERLKDTALAEVAPQIRIERDAGRRTLSVSDNGIGMGRDELIQYLGTIAKSGTKELLAAMEASKEAQADLIGRFGVGFYSVFMVADRVEVVTRKLGTAHAYRFSSTGDGSFTVADAERPGHGTTVTVWLRPVGEDGKDYTEEWTIREIVKRWSDFIAWPIVMPVTRHRDGQDVTEDETLNSQKAIWLRGEKDVSEEELHEFYRHLAHDWREPLAHIRLNAEGSTSFKGLLFIPSEAPLDLSMDPKAGGPSLYIDRVFIMDGCKELIPDHLRFLRGVIDSDDLSLNISREILQDDPIIRVIRRSTQRKVLGELKKMLASDREKYEKFWAVFGRVLKEGILQDREHAKAILDICLFRTTADEGWTTLAAYRERMAPEQKGIYCLTGRDISVLRASPKLGAFTQRGHEVLLMTDLVDEAIVSNVPVTEDIELLDVREGAAALDDEERKEREERIAGAEASFAPLKEQAMAALSAHLKDVRPTVELGGAPACLRDAPGGPSLRMEQMLRAAGQDLPPQKRILELDVEHPLTKGLMRMAERKDPQASDLISLLYDQALILEGAMPVDPAAFVQRLDDLMARSTGA